MVGMFTGLKVGRSRLSVSHLQYVDDTHFFYRKGNNGEPLGH